MIPKKYADEWIQVLNKIVEAFAPKPDPIVHFVEVSLIVERAHGWNYIYHPETKAMTRAEYSPKLMRKFLGRFRVENLNDFAEQLKELIEKPTCRGVKVFVDYSSLEMSELLELRWRENESKC